MCILHGAVFQMRSCKYIKLNVRCGCSGKSAGQGEIYAEVSAKEPQSR